MTNTTTGTNGNDSWNLTGYYSGILDGLGGVDTLGLGTLKRSGFTLAQNVDGSITIDTVSGASGTPSSHIVLKNIEILKYDSGRSSIDLTTYFPAVNHTNSPPTGIVSIAGTNSQGQTLTASNTLADADGLGTISYQWLSGGNVISGATQPIYILTASDVGKSITVKASYTDLQGTAESVTSGATALVTAPTSTYTITPVTTSVNEGGTATFNVATTNVPAGTIAYTLTGTATNGADYISPGLLTIGTNGTGSLAITTIPICQHSCRFL